MSGQSSTGFGGIVNMGLTCYANAVMQSMRHCSRLPWIFQDGRYDSLFQKGDSVPKKRELQQELTRSFASVVQLLERCKENQSVRPGDFWRCLAPAVDDTCFEHLASKAPHDSHEFFLFLLDTIHEAMAQKVEMNILRPPPTTEQEKHIVGALECWKREFSKQYSPLVDIFYGLTHIIVECQTCKATSHRWETFTSLKAAVPKGGLGASQPTLEEMLKAEAEPELIEGYHCDACAPTRTVAKRSTFLWRAPQVLVVVLKRFTPDGRKIHTRIQSIPTTDDTDFAPFFSAESPERTGITSYGLRAIVDHHGGAGGGHYTAQCKHTATQEWYLYDDESASKLAAPIFGDTTYMLFFERTTKAKAA